MLEGGGGGAAVGHLVKIQRGDIPERLFIAHLHPPRRATGGPRRLLATFELGNISSLKS